jgi:hypothetical protein
MDNRSESENSYTDVELHEIGQEKSKSQSIDLNISDDENGKPKQYPKLEDIKDEQSLSPIQKNINHQIDEAKEFNVNENIQITTQKKSKRENNELYNTNFDLITEEHKSFIKKKQKKKFEEDYPDAYALKNILNSNKKTKNKQIINNFKQNDENKKDEKRNQSKLKNRLMVSTLTGKKETDVVQKDDSEMKDDDFLDNVSSDTEVEYNKLDFKLLCSKCGLPPNNDESDFLLCDGDLDKEHGTHYYCAGFMNIPAGDWFCDQHRQKNIPVDSKNEEENKENEEKNAVIYSKTFMFDEDFLSKSELWCVQNLQENIDIDIKEEKENIKQKKEKDAKTKNKEFGIQYT